MCSSSWPQTGKPSAQVAAEWQPCSLVWDTAQPPFRSGDPARQLQPVPQAWA